MDNRTPCRQSCTRSFYTIRYQKEYITGARQVLTFTINAALPDFPRYLQFHSRQCSVCNVAEQPSCGKELEAISHVGGKSATKYHDGHDDRHPRTMQRVSRRCPASGHHFALVHMASKKILKEILQTNLMIYPFQP